MELIQLIPNVGFPIFSFIVAGLACKYMYDKETKRNEILINDNMKKLEELTVAITNNTATLQQLVMEMNKDKKDGE